MPSFSGYSACCADPEEANAKTARMAEARNRTDERRQAFETSANLRKQQLLERVRSRTSTRGSGAQPEVQLVSRLLLRNDDNFGSGNLRQEIFASANVFVHKARWGVGEPLTQRNILVLGRREHLQEQQIGIADVLDIVRQRLIDVAHVTGVEVHGAGVSASRKYGHTGCALHVVLPLIGVGVPVHLPHSA